MDFLSWPTIALVQTSGVMGCSLLSMPKAVHADCRPFLPRRSLCFSPDHRGRSQVAPDRQETSDPSLKPKYAKTEYRAFYLYPNTRSAYRSFSISRTQLFIILLS